MQGENLKTLADVFKLAFILTWLCIIKNTLACFLRAKNSCFEENLAINFCLPWVNRSPLLSKFLLVNNP